MPEMSFMSANFVARQVGFHMTGGWDQGDKATNAYFQPIETFAQRFQEILVAVRAMGFDAIDIWTGHLNWAWATQEHVAIAQNLLARQNLVVTSLAGTFGTTAEEFTAACELAVALRTRVLGGNARYISQDRTRALGILKHYDLRLGLENHPGLLSPEDVRSAIGDSDGGTIGAAIDTGWFGTAGIDAVRAIEELAEHLVIVHLKDVISPGSHVTCRYGRGCVPVQDCVRVLERIGYDGDISIEHEPDDFDPTDDCRASRAMLSSWLTR